MKLAVKSIPYGDLPYKDLESASKMMLKLFPSIPYLPLFPKYNTSETLINRTIKGIPGIREKEGKYVLIKDYEKLKKEISIMEDDFKEVKNLDKYQFSSVFIEQYSHMLKRIKPKHTVLNLMGAFSLSQYLKREELPELITDRIGRKFLIQAACLKALWFIKYIKELSPNTIPIIVFEEPTFNNFGTLKRTNDDVDKDQLIIIYSKIIEKLHESGAMVCVQCFEKCDWQIPLDAGIDIISFDAYTNPNNIAIFSDKINDFLARGGYINWGVIPVRTESLIRSLTIDNVYSKFLHAIENTINEGVSSKLAYNRATVSVQGNLDKHPIMFAEKALILTEQLGRKVPVLS